MDPSQMRLQIYPRRKAGQKKRDHSTGNAVVVTLEVLQGFASMPLVQAAKKLGISKTALKSACRTLCIDRWPFRRSVDAADDRWPDRWPFRRSVDAVDEETMQDTPASRESPQRENCSSDDGLSSSSSLERSSKRQKVEEGRDDRVKTDRGYTYVDYEEAGDTAEGDSVLGEWIGNESRVDLEQRGFGSETDVDKARHRDEDSASGTEEGDGATSSNGAPHGSSDKTSGDERGGRSDCDEGWEQDANVKHGVNDLSWMAYGDSGLETLDRGNPNTLDDTPLVIKPIVIKTLPVVIRHPSSPLSSSSCPKSPEVQLAKPATICSGRGQGQDDYYLHVVGETVPPVACYAPHTTATQLFVAATPARDRDYLIIMNSHPYGLPTQRHTQTDLHPTLQTYHRACQQARHAVFKM